VISLLSHFGSQFSYATVASKIAGRLASEHRLGGVMNLDDTVLPCHAETLQLAQGSDAHSPLLALTSPSPIFETIFTGYKNVGLFLSPNTSQLSPEHVRILDQCRVGFAPSEYCAEIARGQSSVPIEVCRLGVADEYATRRFERRASGLPFTFLHLTTDFYLPGRKGTEEVISAWQAVRSALPDARLIVHTPEAASTHIYYALADQEREDGQGYGRFSVIQPPLRGSTEAELADVLCSADAVVLPSRCEGFGMVILAALVLGVPLITTNVTGQLDFLGDFTAKPGEGCAIRAPFLLVATSGEGPLVGEDGLAPLIHVEALAASMVSLHDNYDALYAATRLVPDAVRQKWTWSSALGVWAEKLGKWEEAR
jgi:glycosyltransferase involved in cell wall biosynthesis